VAVVGLATVLLITVAELKAENTDVTATMPVVWDLQT
jgi:hypothetical protein